MFDKIVTGFCYVILLYFVVNEFHHLYWTPVSVKSDLYERHYNISGTFPFIGSYFLMEPVNYNPNYKYPVVVVLHGISKRVYAAEYLAQEKFRDRYPTFVLVPLAPKRAFWEQPANDQYALPQLIPYPDHMPSVMNALQTVSAKYQVDQDRIYITGHSMGGMGVIGALQNYPNVFAGGLALSGTWDPAETQNITAPLWLFHGGADAQIPVGFSRNIAGTMKQSGQFVQYTELAGEGHDIWKIIYPSASVWTGMFAQRKIN